MDVELGVLPALAVVNVLVLALHRMHVHLEVGVVAEDGSDVGPLTAYAFLEVVEGSWRRIMDLR